jgi:hypothetical protein
MKYLVIIGVGTPHATIYSITRSPVETWGEDRLVGSSESFPFLFGGAPVSGLRLYTEDGQKTEWFYFPLNPPA